MWRATAITSLVLIAGLNYAEIFIFPVLATEFSEVVTRYGDGVAMPSVAFVFPLSGILFLFGYVLFGYELFRTNAVDRRAVLVLIGSVVVFAAGLSRSLPFVVIKIDAVLFGIGLISVGASLMVDGTDDVSPV